LEGRGRVLLFCVFAACLCAAACSPRRLYYSATHKIVRIPTDNMLPTIKVGDYAAVDAGYYEKHPVERFDMVIFTLPPENIDPERLGTQEGTVYLKRVVGLGGETLEIKGGRVYVDGRALEEPFETVPLESRDKFGPVRVPEGEYFLLGDNRQNSMDSRFWPRPTLPKRNLLGKVVEIFHE
jgi:signal peptidase I